MFFLHFIKKNGVQQILVSDVPLFAIAINAMDIAADPLVSAAPYVEDTVMYYISWSTVIIT
jgi:hypothetical protein